MTWLAPWAWALALAAVLPIAAHLWSRRRPAPLAFPTLRFLRAASPVSRRLRRVQDWPLLLLRLAIVALVCAAAAGPTLTSSWRQHAWRTRLHRVIVVDESVATPAADVVAAERQGVTSSTTLGPLPLAELIDEAIADASAYADRMRTEIVIVWDGSRDALVPEDLQDVPTGTGLRLVPVGAAATGRTPTRGGTGTPAVAIRAAAADQSRRDRVSAMLPALGPADGTPPTEIVWPGIAAVPPESSATSSHALRRLLDELADDPRVRDAAERSVRDGRQSARGCRRADGRCLARDANGDPILRGWIDGDHVVLVLDATTASPLAWWSSLAAVESSARPWQADVDKARWSPSELKAATRAAELPPAGTLPGGLDTRMAWALALALLLFEQWWRVRVAGVVSQEAGDAA